MKLLKESPKAIALSAAEVVRIWGEGNYSHVQYACGKVVLMAFPLKRYAERLPGFLRIHKQHLINPKFVLAIYGQRGNSMVSMRNGQTLPISRRRYNNVVNQLNP